MNDDGTIDLSMDNPTESKIIDIFLGQDNLMLNGKSYLVIKRVFSELEPAIYIQVKEIVWMLSVNDGRKGKTHHSQ